MAVETRARLRLRLALGVLLIDEYVRGSVLFYVSMFPLVFLTRRRDSKVSAIETVFERNRSRRAMPSLVCVVKEVMGQHLSSMPWGPTPTVHPSSTSRLRVG